MQNDKYTVYMHRHKANGKVYIGCTKKSLNARFDNGNGYKRCTRFWEAIQSDGFDAFEHTAIAEGLTQEEAHETEEKLIDFYDAMNPEHGYNLRRGGKHNTPCREVGQRISKAKMNHEVSKETRDKLRKHGTKKVIQKTMGGDPIQVFDSLTDAARAVGGYKSNIYAVCVGKKPSCRNYKWEYFKEVI